ncbi:colicin transporter [uncultured Parasphingorhabdus sp.]|uniref:colicin transporter n=1 Tax=uncultured Parasphingorhabdus sp. TaxID=2709694 RepID=UPI0030DB4DA7|tara:strand:- start:25392 stop:25991 length:600 start_codon:yes stop_codon:yes gene_type:complete
MLAFKRLEGMGWLALVFLVAILLYPLSLSVATLRSDLARTDRKIVEVKKDIRYLETEFSARANLRQLEEWNKLEFGYASPVAAQYLDGERALANLGGKDLRKPVRVAVLSSMDGIKPAGIIGSVFGTAKAQDRNADGSAIGSHGQLASAATTNGHGSGPGALQSRTARVAHLEDKLLDDGLVRDLGRKAIAEKIESLAE